MVFGGMSVRWWVRLNRCQMWADECRLDRVWVSHADGQVPDVLWGSADGFQM